MKIFIALLLLLTAMSSMGGKINISSLPAGAEIFVKNTSTGEYIRVGGTPFKSDFQKFKKSYGLQQNFMIEIRKPNFKEKTILIGVLNRNELNLEVSLEESLDIKLTQKYDAIVQDLFEAQRRVRNKDYKGSLSILDRLEKDYSFLSVISEMKGGVYYLQKKFNRSLASYRKAYGLNPKNNDAYSMKRYLEKTIGVQNGNK